MTTLLEKIESGVILNEEEWNIAVTLFRATLVQVEKPPYQPKKEVALTFIELMLGWGVINFRLQKNADTLKIHSLPNEDWDEVGDLLAELLGTAEGYCEIFGLVDFDVQLQRRLIEAGLTKEEEEEEHKGVRYLYY